VPSTQALRLDFVYLVSHPGLFAPRRVLVIDTLLSGRINQLDISPKGFLCLGAVLAFNGSENPLGAGSYLTADCLVSNASFFTLPKPLCCGTLDYQRIYPPGCTYITERDRSKKQ
jgi:hypothetical protein